MGPFKATRGFKWVHSRPLGGQMGQMGPVEATRGFKWVQSRPLGGRMEPVEATRGSNGTSRGH